MRRTASLVTAVLAVALSGISGPALADTAVIGPERSSGVAPSGLTLPAPGVPAPPSVDGTVVVHGLDYPDDGSYGLYSLSCADPRAAGHDPHSLLYINYSSDEPPIGMRMQGFDLTGTAGIGPYAYTPTPSTSEWQLRVNPVGVATTGHAVAFYFPDGWAGEQYVGHASVSHAGPGWSTLDAQARSLQWWKWSEDTQTWQSGGMATLAAFVANHGGDGTLEEGSGALLGFALGCDGERFWFDGLRVGPPGEVITYDYEGGLTAALMDSSDARVTAGRKTVVRGSLDTEVSGFYASLEMVLEARQIGEPEFVEVGRATSTYDDTTGTQSPVRLAVRPERHTEYRWSIPDSPHTEGSHSPVATLEVRSAASLKMARSKVAKGAKLVASGDVVPADAGVDVALQRQVGKKWKTLATGRTKADGSYRLVTKASSKGTWKLRVKVAETPTNLAGTSQVRKVTVR